MISANEQIKGMFLVLILSSALFLGSSLAFATDNSLVIAPEAPEIRLAFLGDIMLDRAVAREIKARGFRELLAKFKAAAHLDTYDLVVANLEGAFAVRRIATKKSIAFRFDPMLAPELVWLGIDAVSLANNHGLDMGRANLEVTRSLLEDQTLTPFGDPLAINGFTTRQLEIKGRRLALLGFNTTFGTLTEKQMIAAVRQAKRNSDLVIPFMHWGNEYQKKAHGSQRRLARALIDAGAVAIVGAHPHVVQNIENYRGAPIIYSLGNFIFDQYFSRATQEGVLAELTISSQGGAQVSTRNFHSIRSEPIFNKEF